MSAGDAAYYDRAELWGQEPEEYQVQARADILSLIPLGVRSVADIGCGDGFVTNALPPRFDVVGIDWSREALQHVQYPTLVGTIEQIPLPDASHDLVVATDVLEHVPGETYGRAIAELTRVARSYILIGVPFEEDFAAHRIRCATCGLLYHVNDHQRAYDERALASLLGREFELVQLRYSGATNRVARDVTTRARHLVSAYDAAPAAVCPRCGSRHHESRALPTPAERLLAAARSASWGATLASRGPWPMRTEAIALFARNGDDALQPVNSPLVRRESLLRIDFTNPLQRARVGFSAGSPWARYVLSDQVDVSENGIRLRHNEPIAAAMMRFPVVAGNGDLLRVGASGSARGGAGITLTAYDGLRREEFHLAHLAFGGRRRTAEVTIEHGWPPDGFGTAVNLYLEGGVVLHEAEWIPRTGVVAETVFTPVTPGHTVAAVNRSGRNLSWGYTGDAEGTMPCPELDPERPFPATYPDAAQYDGLSVAACLASTVRRPRAATRGAADARPEPKSVLMLVHDRRIDRRVLDEARTLVAAGWEVTVVAGPADPTQERRDEEVYPDLAIVRVEAGEVTPATVLQLDPAVQVPWRLFSPYHEEFVAEALARPAEVIVAHDLPQLGAAAIAAAVHGSYLVYDSHELYPEQDLFLDLGIAWFLVALEAWLLRRVDATITVNASIAAFIEARYGLDHVHVILNAPDLDGERGGSAQTLRDRLGIPESQKILLFQGGYAPTRNLENLIAAMAVVQHPVALVLLGPGFELDSPAIRQAAGLGLLNERVFATPPVAQTELLSMTASADAGVIPYRPRSELAVLWCTPNKLFEFIAAGVPIIASDLPELRRYVRDQGVGITAPMRSAADIAAAIDAFFASDVGVYQARAQALSREFTWPGQGKHLVEIFKQLATAPARAREAIDVDAERVAADAVARAIPPWPLAPVSLETLGGRAVLHELVRRATTRARAGVGRALASTRFGGDDA